jgi:hypothetical protein
MFLQTLPKSSYLILLRVGFSLPQLLLIARCALTAPFHPYLLRGGLFSVALSVDLHRPGVTWHSARWSPDFPLLKNSDCLDWLERRIAYFASAYKNLNGKHEK